MAILILAEHDNINLNPVTRNLVSAAQYLAQEIDVLVTGYNCSSVWQDAQLLQGINKVLVADNLAYQYNLAENVAELLKDLSANYSYILAPATTFGKNILPRTAGLLEVEHISDVIEIKSGDTFVRPMAAGNIIATVQSIDRIKLLTIRKTAFAACGLASKACELEHIDLVCDQKLSRFVSAEISDFGELPDLSNALIVVAGGRGLKSKENFSLIENLAKPLHAAIGASRAAVDAGFISNDCQVGQTGKVVAPDLYFAIGISGAIQHIAGMKDSKVIVAINIDPEAPIFKIADYGLVGDLFELMPRLIDLISKGD